MRSAGAHIHVRGSAHEKREDGGVEGRRGMREFGVGARGQTSVQSDWPMMDGSTGVRGGEGVRGLGGNFAAEVEKEVSKSL